MPAFTLYELVCKDSRIKDKYLGFTSSSIEDFWLNQQHKYRDKTTGEIMSSKQDPTPLQAFIEDTGGVKNWEFVEIDRFDSRARVTVEKFKILQSDIGSEYTINTYYTDKKRVSREES
jgi:hypothetical protein